MFIFNGQSWRLDTSPLLFCGEGSVVELTEMVGPGFNSGSTRSVTLDKKPTLSWL